MKKIIVQIKDIAWYESNCDQNGIVYKDPSNDTDLFSRGQSQYCGKVAEVTDTDTYGNFRLNIDSGEWLWKEWHFIAPPEERDVQDIIETNIQDAEFVESSTEEPIKNTPILLEDNISINTTTEKIKSISEWKLNFIMGTVVNLLTSSTEENKTEYMNNIRTAITFLQNELERLK